MSLKKGLLKKHLLVKLFKKCKSIVYFRDHESYVIRQASALN